MNELKKKVRAGLLDPDKVSLGKGRDTGAFLSLVQAVSKIRRPPLSAGRPF
jgi:hypothetical protein